MRSHHSPRPGRTHEVDDRAVPYLTQVFWAGLITVAYLPSTVFPTGLAEDGPPIGLQAAGAEFEDYTCLQFAWLMAAELGGFQAPFCYED